MMTPGEVNDFEAAHGGAPVRLDGKLFYFDGALIHAGGFVQQPSSDPRYRLNAQAKAHRILLEQAERDLHLLEASVESHGRAPGLRWPTPGDWRLKHYGNPPVDAHRQPDVPAAQARLRGIVERETRIVAELQAQAPPVHFGVG